MKCGPELTELRAAIDLDDVDGSPIRDGHQTLV
jgi:hypothetical protein